MENNQRDRSKLRPYDLTTAKVGDKVISARSIKAVVVYVSKEQIVFDWGKDGVNVFNVFDYHTIYQQPLAWLKDMPVYAGDKIWDHIGKEYTAVGTSC